MEFKYTFCQEVEDICVETSKWKQDRYKRLEPIKEYVACRLGIRHSTGEPKRKKRLYVIGVDGGLLLKSPFKK